jgi:integrase/recombinase XerD
MRRNNKLSAKELTPIEQREPAYFEHAIKLFIDDCKVRSLSEHTVKYYQNELKMVKRYLNEQVQTNDTGQVTTADIKGLIVFMKENGSKEGAINTRLRAGKAFFRFLEREGIISHNPFTDVKLVREKKNVIEAFTTEQVRVLLSTPDRTTFTGLRDYTLMVFMLETGVRLKELAGIRLHHINFEHNYVRITETKNYQERNVPIQSGTVKVLKNYLRVRGQVDTDFLFLTIENTPLTYRQIQKRIAHIGDMSGVKNVRVSPHTFRHTFAKMAVQNGANIFELQAILGHSSIEMVRRYVNLFSADIAAGHRKFSPVEKLNI